MKQSTAISVALHVAVLAWATLSYSGRALEAPKTEAMPVTFISAKDFTKMTKGVKQAPKKKKPKALVDKIDTPKPKPIDDAKAKVAKKEVKAATDKTPPPEPKVKPPEKPKKEAKAEPKPPPKIDPIADKLKQENAKKHLAKIAPKLPPRRPPRPHHKEPQFNADKIAALLNKRTPKRLAEAGETLSVDPSLGSPQHNDKILSASEIAQLIDKIRGCWDLPYGNQQLGKVIIPITIHLRPDGMLRSTPTVDVGIPNGPMQAIARSAVSAIIRCQPYTMFSESKYAAWKDLPLGFDPSYMYAQ
jgi:outer membrane biosynthesis protein TonB